MTTRCTMILGDCLDVMPTLAGLNAGLAICDFPYNAVDCTWDKTPFDVCAFASRLHAVRSSKWSMVATSTYRFSQIIFNEFIKWFKYDLIFKKSQPVGFFNAKKQPLRQHELILLFGTSCVYNPQMRGPSMRHGRIRTDTTGVAKISRDGVYGQKMIPEYQTGSKRFPTSVVDAPRSTDRGLHPTQKPVSLIDWLIRTYSNAGDMVLDPTAGSGTTAVSACQNGRSVTCIEKDEGYFEASVERVRKHIRDNLLDVKLEVRK